MDIPAEKMIFGVQGIDAGRRDRLIKVTHRTGTHLQCVITSVLDITVLHLFLALLSSHDVSCKLIMI